MLNNKLFVVIVFFLFLNKEVKAQYFAPVGAEWFYKGNSFLTSYGIGYVRFVVEKDTVIQGLSCSKITGKEYFPLGTTKDYGPDFVRYDEGKVFYFKANKFRLMYDFTQNIGDTLEVFNYSEWNNDSLSHLKVDTIYYKDYDGVILKTYEYRMLDITPDIQYWGPVVERIGDLFWLFPQNGILFDSEPGNLRCYIDSNMHLNRSYSDTTACDEFWQNPLYSVLFENKKANQVNISPNPNNGFFSISLKKELINSYCQLFDAIGNKVFAEKLSEDLNQIDVSFLSNGIYFLKLFEEDISIETYKIIIE